MEELTKSELTLLKFMMNFELNPKYDKYAFSKTSIKEKDMHGCKSPYGDYYLINLKKKERPLWYIESFKLTKINGWFLEQELKELYSRKSHSKLNHSYFSRLQEKGFIEKNYLKYKDSLRKKALKQPRTIWRIKPTLQVFRNIIQHLTTNKEKVELCKSHYFWNHPKTNTYIREFSLMIHGFEFLKQMQRMHANWTKNLKDYSIIHNTEGWPLRNDELLESLQNPEIQMIFVLSNLFTSYLKNPEETTKRIKSMYTKAKKLKLDSNQVYKALIMCETYNPENPTEMIHLLDSIVRNPDPLEELKKQMEEVVGPDRSGD